jgi:hypothetical protein
MTLATLNATVYTVSGLLLTEHNQKKEEMQTQLIAGSRNLLFFASKALNIPLEDLTSSNGAVLN